MIDYCKFTSLKVTATYFDVLFYFFIYILLQTAFQRINTFTTLLLCKTQNKKLLK